MERLVFNQDTFGAVITRIRIHRGLRQKDVAKELGYTVHHINSVERGRIKAGNKMMREYLALFGYEFAMTAIPKEESNEKH